MAYRARLAMGEAAGTTVEQPPLVAHVPAANRLPMTAEDADIMARQFDRLSRWMVAARVRCPLFAELYMDHQVAVIRRFIGDYVERLRHISAPRSIFDGEGTEPTCA